MKKTLDGGPYIMEIIRGHCVIGRYARRIDLGHLANDFCRSCGDEEENKTVLHLLCTWSALWRKKYLVLTAWRIFIGGYEWFLNVWQSVNLWHHNGLCLRPKCMRSWLHQGDSHFYLPTLASFMAIRQFPSNLKRF